MADTLEVMITHDEILGRVKDLADMLNNDYNGTQLLIVSVMKGAFVFTADLVRELNLELDITFITASSYKDSMTTSGKIEILGDVDISVLDRDVLIVEDIVDTGITLANIKEDFIRRGAKSVKICSMFNKPSRRVSSVKPDYCGFDIEDYFIVGYGLDYANKYRQLKNACKLSI